MPEDQYTQPPTTHSPEAVQALADRLAWIDPAANWRDDALCAEVASDLFFPDKGGSSKDAKRLCAACDVRSACLDFAVDNDERFGVWGGLSERERRKLRPSPSPSPSPSAPRPVRERRPVGIDHGTEAGRKAHLRLGDPMCASCDTAADPVPAPAPPPEAPRDRPGVTRPWRHDELVEAVALLTGYGMTTADIAAELHVSASRVRAAGRALAGAA